MDDAIFAQQYILAVRRPLGGAQRRSQAVFDGFYICFCFQSRGADPLRGGGRAPTHREIKNARGGSCPTAAHWPLALPPKNTGECEWKTSTGNFKSSTPARLVCAPTRHRLGMGGPPPRRRPRARARTPSRPTLLRLFSGLPAVRAARPPRKPTPERAAQPATTKFLQPHQIIISRGPTNSPLHRWHCMRKLAHGLQRSRS